MDNHTRAIIDEECVRKEHEKARVYITTQHAYSLSELVKWFKEMIEQGNTPEAPGRSDELTAGYCDELLKDLEEGD